MPTRRELVGRAAAVGPLVLGAGCSQSSDRSTGTERLGLDRIDSPLTGERTPLENELEDDGWLPGERFPMKTEWRRVVGTDETDYLRSVATNGEDVLAAAGTTVTRRDSEPDRYRPWILGFDDGGTGRWQRRAGAVGSPDTSARDVRRGWASDLVAFDGDFLLGIRNVDPDDEDWGARVSRVAPDGREREVHELPGAGYPELATAPADVAGGPLAVVGFGTEDGEPPKLLALSASGATAWRQSFPEHRAGWIDDLAVGPDGLVRVAVAFPPDTPALARILKVTLQGTVTDEWVVESEVDAARPRLNVSPDGSLVSVFLNRVRTGLTVLWGRPEDGSGTWSRVFRGWYVGEVLPDRRFFPGTGHVLVMHEVGDLGRYDGGARLVGLREDGEIAWVDVRTQSTENWRFVDATFVDRDLFVGAQAHPQGHVAGAAADPPESKAAGLLRIGDGPPG